MIIGPKWGANPQSKFLGLKTEKSRDQCLQFGACNFGTEANFCTLKTAVLNFIIVAVFCVCINVGSPLTV